MSKFFIQSVGTFIIVDDIDDFIIQSSTWSPNNGGYLIANRGKYKKQFLHRIIAERMCLNSSKLIDHIDRNIYNNRRLNFRVATKSQNAMNSKIRSDRVSGFKGVFQRGDKWEASIQAYGKYIYLGRFNTEEEAHEVRKEAEIKYFGEFANDF